MVLSGRALIKSAVLVFALTTATFANAVSFGEAKVFSYLDEPLSVDIELSNLNGILPDEIQVKLADPNDFIKAGIARPYALNYLNFTVLNYQSKTYLYITSSKAIRDPYLDFLIEVAWVGGTVVKHYTLLIDPPPKDLDSTQRPLANGAKSIKDDELRATGSDLEQRAQLQAQMQKRRADPNRQTSFSDTTYKPTGKEGETPVTLLPGTSPQPQESAPADAATPESENVPTVEPVTPAVVAKPIAQPQQPEPAVTNPVPPDGPQTKLGATIENLKAIDLMDNLKTDLQQLKAARQKQKELFKDAGDLNPEPEIDFGDVIKPNASSDGAQNNPGAPNLATIGAAGAVAPQSSSSGGGLGILLAGIALGIVGVVGFGLKRGWHKKLFASRYEIDEIVEDTIVITETEEEYDVDIELDSSVHKVQTQNSAVDIVPKTAPNQEAQISRTMHDLLNLAAVNSDASNDTAISTETKEVKSEDAAPAPEPETTVDDAFRILGLNPAAEGAAPRALEPVSEQPPEAPSEQELVISEEEQANIMKFDLAKKYLEAGDRDTARAILNEIIATETTSDAQKLEAEIILSSII